MRVFGREENELRTLRKAKQMVEGELFQKENISGLKTTDSPEFTDVQITSLTADATLGNVAKSIRSYLVQLWSKLSSFMTATESALGLKAPLASPALTGTPTAPTAASGTNSTQISTTAFVQAAISALVASSPAALDTLNELAAALGSDPNFATTMTNALAGKAAKSGTVLDSSLTVNTDALAIDSSKNVKTKKGLYAQGRIFSTGNADYHSDLPSVTACMLYYDPVNDYGQIATRDYVAGVNKYVNFGTLVRMDVNTGTTATGGSATALPSQPVGYMEINIGGTVRKIPYYS